MRAVFISTLLALLISSATATIAARSPNPAATLFARQTGIDPTNVNPLCIPTCSEIADTLNNCSDLSCLCTTTAAQQIALCADCLIAVAGSEASASSTQQSEQVIIDQFTNACAENGQPISSIIVSSLSPTITATSGTGSETVSASAASTNAPVSGSGSSSSAASQVSSVTSPSPTTSGASASAVLVFSSSARMLVIVGLMAVVQALL